MDVVFSGFIVRTYCACGKLHDCASRLYYKSSVCLSWCNIAVHNWVTYTCSCTICMYYAMLYTTLYHIYFSLVLRRGTINIYIIIVHVYHGVATVCVRTTYFTFRGQISISRFGTTMGSSLSPIMANCGKPVHEDP